MTNMHDYWNRCDECGQFIPYNDFADDLALRRLEEPSNEFGVETWTTLCRTHFKPVGYWGFDPLRTNQAS